MLVRILTAVAVAVLVGLACLLAGSVLVLLRAPIAVTIGDFLAQWAWVIGLLAGILQFARGGFIIG